MRIFRRTVLDVARRIMDGRGPIPVDTDEKVQIGFEARALRYWEMFDEGIYRWRILSSSTPATPSAGQRKALDINGLGGQVEYPRGSWWTVDACRNVLPASAGQGIEVLANSGISGSVIQAFALDRRNVPGLTPIPVLVLGDWVTTAGQVWIASGAPGYQDIIPIEYASVANPEDSLLQNGGKITIRNPVADGSFQVEVWGRYYIAER